LLLSEKCDIITAIPVLLNISMTYITNVYSTFTSTLLKNFRNISTYLE